MKTDRQWKENLEHHLITETMLASAVSSADARKANWHRQKEKYRGVEHDGIRYDMKADQRIKALEKTEERLLTAVPPICIRKEIYGFRTRRVYETDSSFSAFLAEAVKEGTLVRIGRNAVAAYGEISDLSLPRYRLWRCYGLKGKVFELPLAMKEAYLYKDLPAVSGPHKTPAPPEDPVSMQFVHQLEALIETRNYTYVTEDDPGILLQKLLASDREEEQLRTAAEKQCRDNRERVLNRY